MKKAWSLAFLAFMLAALPGVGHAEDDETQALVKRGKALRYSVKTTAPANSIDTGGAAIYVSAPLAEVRKIITDYRHYDQFIKPFEQSRLLSRRKGVSEVYFEVPIMHGAAKIWCVVNFEPPSKDAAGETIAARSRQMARKSSTFPRL